MTRIESTPKVLGGRPHIAGSRVTVHSIVVLHKWHKWSVKKIAAELKLSVDEVNAALAYYGEHREEIDRLIEEARKLDAAIPRDGHRKVKR